MRFQAVVLLSIGLCLATSNAFFLKKAKVLPATLATVKLNLEADATTAVGDLKEASHLKAKALTGGIKAIGTAKLGVLKGIKDAKVGAVKAVVDTKLAKVGAVKAVVNTKLAKVAAVKASKVALAKTLLNAKLSSFAAAGAHFGVSSGISSSSSGSNSSSSSGTSASATSGSLASSGGVSDGISDSSSSSSASSYSAASASASSGSLASNFGTILQFGRDDKLTLYPPANAAPTHINIVTYRNSESSSGQSSGVGNIDGYAPRPIVVPAPLTSYGLPAAEDQTKFTSGPSTSYGTSIRPIPPSTSYGVPILR